jgi:polysaccharide pyruvyl transferase WcaK-like protein
METMQTAKATILGYQGFGNVGDEAILTGLEAALEGSRIQVTDVICGDSAPVAGFPKADRLPSRRLLPSLAGLQRLRSSDLLVLSGGGLIHDHWAIVIPRYLAWTLLARSFGVPVVWAAIGVGPIDREKYRRLAGWIVDNTALLTVRDKRSQDWVAKVRPARTVEIAADPAFFNVVPTAPATRRGLALIGRLPTPRDAVHGDRIVGALAELAREHDKDRRAIITMAGDLDEPFLARLVERIGPGGPPPIHRLGPNPREALELMSSFEAVVSVRLHGLIFCALTGVPCVPIAYDEKVRSAAERLGLGDLAVDLADVTPELLRKRLAQAREPERMATVASRVAGFRDEGLRLRRMFEEVMWP